MTNQEQYERVWSKAEDYDRLKEQVLTSEKVYEGHIKRLEAENAELKRLLKLAIEDLERCDWCSLCKYNDDVTCVSAVDNCFVWKHAEEVMRIVGYIV